MLLRGDGRCRIVILPRVDYPLFQYVFNLIWCLGNRRDHGLIESPLDFRKFLDNVGDDLSNLKWFDDSAMRIKAWPSASGRHLHTLDRWTQQASSGGGGIQESSALISAASQASGAAQSLDIELQAFRHRDPKGYRNFSETMIFARTTYDILPSSHLISGKLLPMRSTWIFSRFGIEKRDFWLHCCRVFHSLFHEKANWDVSHEIGSVSQSILTYQIPFSLGPSDEGFLKSSTLITAHFRSKQPKWAFLVDQKSYCGFLHPLMRSAFKSCSYGLRTQKKVWNLWLCWLSRSWK
jgi:hypothetical protein